MDALLRRRLMMQQGGGPTPPPAPQPEFFTHLQFAGGAYIRTGLTLPENCSIRVGLGNETLKSQQRVFGAGSGSGPIRFQYTSSTTSTRRYMGVYYDGTTQLAGSNYVNFSYATYTFFMTPNGWGVGTNFFPYTKGNDHAAGELILGQNDALTGNAYTGTMSTYSIFGSDAANNQTSDFSQYTPWEYMVPCRYNGEDGMWIVGEGRFVGNSAGVGTLTALNL